MTHQPLVSVIIIFLNGESFIEEAIDSVIAQIYSNWEILLVDDGSTDGSTAIAQRYVLHYPEKIRYLEHSGHQNFGMSASRNLGIHHAQGEYIALLDADDVFLPEKLTQQVEILESHPDAAMVYSSTQYWYSWTGRIEDSQRDFLGNLGVQTNTLFTPFTLAAQFLKFPGIVPCNCGLLVRRQIVEAVGGFDLTFRDLYEDQVFIFKLCLKAPVFVAAGAWEKYRQRPDSSWHTSLDNGKDYQARLTFLKWLERYLIAQGLDNTEVWHILQTHLWNYQHPNLYRLNQGLKQVVKQWERGVRASIKQLLSTEIFQWLNKKLTLR
jgi:glycosyltransferase involved in cell wall biosynthesis